MIIVDTSVWIDLFRASNEVLVRALHGAAEPLLVHEFVVGELALGNFRDRSRPFLRLQAFRKAPTASSASVFDLIETHRIHGAGIGYVDAHLLASTLLIEGGRLWTRDKRLVAVAERLQVGIEIE